MEQTLTAASPRQRLPLTGLLAANAISLLGSALTAVALPWFVLQTTGSASRTGLTAAAAVLPAFAAGVFGGVLVDRAGFKRVSVAADLVSGIAIASIPLLYQTVGLAFWQILVLVLLGALLEVPGLTARRSLLPDLASAAQWRLERANSAFESTNFLALLLGPPLAGLLIAALGAANVLWLDAATFALSAILVGAAVFAPPPRQRSASSRSYRADLVAGLRFLRADRLLLVLALSLTASNCLLGPFVAVLLPVYARQTTGRATTFGFALAALGAGPLAGALAYGAIGHRLPRRATWLAAFLIAPGELWLLLISPPFPVLLLALALLGVFSGPINPLLVTIRHERIPEVLRGRVFSTFSALAIGAQPLGLLLAGTLIDVAGFRPTILLLAATAQTLGLLLVFVPTLHGMDATKPTPVAT
jgi:MFS family permease